MTSFNIFCHELIDAWLQSDSNTRPEDPYAAVLGKLTIKMARSVVGTVPYDPHGWQFRRVRNFGLNARSLIG